MSPWRVLLGRLSSCPVLMSSHSDWLEDRVPVDDIYGYPIFESVAMTWQLDGNGRIQAQRAHDTILASLLGQNDVAASFWRNNAVIFASCVRREENSRQLQHKVSMSMYLLRSILKTCVIISRFPIHVCNSFIVKIYRFKIDASYGNVRESKRMTPCVFKHIFIPGNAE